MPVYQRLTSAHKTIAFGAYADNITVVEGDRDCIGQEVPIVKRAVAAAQILQIISLVLPAEKNLAVMLGYHSEIDAQVVVRFPSQGERRMIDVRNYALGVAVHQTIPDRRGAGFTFGVDQIVQGYLAPFC